VISRQVKHLAVLFMESLRITVENPTETKQAKEKNQKFLLAQIRSLVNGWIIKFDPMKQNLTAHD